MSQIADASFIGKGEAFLQPYDGLSAAVSMGNCSEITIGQSQDEKSILDFTNAGGGKANSISRNSGIPINIKAYDRNAHNMALAALGSRSTIAAAAVTAEPHVAFKGGLVPFDFIPDTTIAVVVKDATDTTTYVDGTDYIVNGAGIYVLSGSAIPDAVAGAVNLHVAYTKLASSRVQALTQSAQVYKLFVVGLNEAQSGKAAIVTVHRYKPGGAASIALIGDDYDPLDIPGESLSDSAITEVGASKFWKYDFA
ncbi:MAG: hypothetical protein M0Q15_16100 [Nevskia sp.]|jgi:hypothetical protein|nr:hypothetical protein [Nevskia sp.]